MVLSFTSQAHFFFLVIDARVRFFFVFVVVVIVVVVVVFVTANDCYHANEFLSKIRRKMPCDFFPQMNENTCSNNKKMNKIAK